MGIEACADEAWQGLTIGIQAQEEQIQFDVVSFANAKAARVGI